MTCEWRAEEDLLDGCAVILSASQIRGPLRGTENCTDLTAVLGIILSGTQECLFPPGREKSSTHGSVQFSTTEKGFHTLPGCGLASAHHRALF